VAVVSIELLERAASALGPLCEEVVFLGGACIELWITDLGAPTPRPTRDVDVVVDITTRLGYERFSERMRAQGFSEDSSSAVICRWRHERRGLLLDAMPVNPHILALGSHWAAAAVRDAAERSLPSGALIRAASPPYLLATKLEAFADRGSSDPLASRDFEDVITLLDNRAEIVQEIRSAPGELRTYLARELRELERIRDFLTIVAAMLRPDRASQARLEAVVLPRLREIASLS
jgi:predicted nucleotidyltransferase